jgi:hypothetical protein
MRTAVGQFWCSAMFIVMLVNVVELSGCKETLALAHTDVQYTAIQLSELATFIKEEEANSIPHGTVVDLEAWLNMKCKDEATKQMVLARMVERSAAVVQASSDGTLHLRDTWGHALVYKYPSDMPQLLFRLYSLGPKGVDENGKGANIDGSPPVPRDGNHQ